MTEHAILVLGATKGIGKKVTETALERGHSVRAFARSADEMTPAQNLDRFAGDALEAGDIARALEGQSAVVFALGISESISMLWEEVTLFSESTKILLPAMKEAGVSRLVVVTGFGAGDSKEAMSTVERMGHRAILGKPYADKDRQEALIKESDLDWTIVRPTILTNNGPSHNYQVLSEQSDWKNGLVSRADVADYCVSAIEDNRHIRESVVLRR